MRTIFIHMQKDRSERSWTCISTTGCLRRTQEWVFITRRPEELAMVRPQRERPPVFVPPRKRIRAAVKIQRRFRWRVAKLILQCVHRFD
jgi:hypothetical protein